jgi:uncharacterized protein (DUF924 family)
MDALKAARYATSATKEAGMVATWSEVLEFWFGAPNAPDHGEPRDAWFEKSAEFDAEVRDRFVGTWVAAAQHQLDGWLDEPQSALALIIVLDQFPRNMFRASAKAFVADRQAQSIADRFVSRGWDRDLKPAHRWFVYLPFEHAESLPMQERSMALFAGLVDHAGSASAIDFARRHYEVIKRFGRFPHRNAILGRDSTPAELEFLKQPGSGF